MPPKKPTAHHLPAPAGARASRAGNSAGAPPAPPGSRFLEAMTWVEAEAALDRADTVAIPLGALLKQHGPHLPLNTDWLTAEWLGRRIAARTGVLVTPTVGFHYYPAFTEYPGTVSADPDTSCALVTQMCRNLSRFGPRRFYVINTGVSTRGPLARSVAELAHDGILMRFSDIEAAGAAAVRAVEQQPHGGHADEIETSMMLVIAPRRVRMALACADGGPGRGVFRRIRGPAGLFSPSGVNGDARLATRAKGRAVLAAMVADMVADIVALRGLPLPPALDSAAESG